MNNRAYWKKRMELLEASQVKKGQDYLIDLENQYRITSSNIEKDITAWYSRFAANNNITMAEAKKLLNSRELKEFRWDVMAYIKYGERNALNQQWMKELENASARVHISRLEAIKLQVQQEIETLYGNYTDGVDKHLMNVYSDGYYHTAYEIQKGFNVGWDFQDLNSKQLGSVLSKPWTMDGKTFSNRIWSNKQQLIGSLQTGLTQAIIRGHSPDKIIKNIAEQFRVDKNKAGRLVMTETAAFASAAQKDAFNSLDVEKFEIVATLDNRTSEICQDLDGHVFDMKDYEVGATAPPFHSWCRTTTVPYFQDNYGERIARGADGETYFVPSDMTYEDWYKERVKQYGQKQVDIQDKMARNETSDKMQYKSYKEVLGNIAPKTFDKFQNLKYNNAEEWSTLKGDYRKINAYNKIIANEPPITKDMMDVSQSSGMGMVGLEYRLKTKESYLRKVNMDSDNSLDPQQIDDTISKTNDVIRYTYQADHGNLVAKYKDVNKDLLNRGYKQTKLKNTWLVKANPYKGINCNYIAPSGQGFEIQYHTPESFELKNGELHKLYEKWRLITDKASDEAVSLSQKMAELSSKLKYPKNIDEVR